MTVTVGLDNRPRNERPASFIHPVPPPNATLREYSDRTRGYRIEYLNGTTWRTAYTGTTIGGWSC